MDALKDEMSILNEVNNLRIMKVFEIFQDETHFYLVSELYRGPDLTYVRDRATKQGVAMTTNWWVSIFQQCLEGLMYLHKHAVMHCDVKESNIMLKTEYAFQPDVVFIDFGLAQEFTHAQRVLCGTPGYIPPETWRLHKWFPKGDAFSMGVTMLQLLSGRTGIFCEAQHQGPEAYDDIARFTMSSPTPLHLLPLEMTSLSDLVGGLLQKDMSSRFNSVQALQDTCFLADTA